MVQDDKGEKNIIILDFQFDRQEELFHAIYEYNKNAQFITANEHVENQWISVLKRNSLEYKKALKEAKWIFTDQIFSKKLNLSKKQKLCYFPHFYEGISFADVQRTLRISQYNIFDSSEYAEQFLKTYNMQFILQSKNICFDYINHSCEFVNALFTQSFDESCVLSHSNKKNVLIYVNKLVNQHQKQFVRDYIVGLPKQCNYFLMSQDVANLDFIKEYNLNIQFLIYPKSIYSKKEKLMFHCMNHMPFLQNKILSKLNAKFKKNAYKNLNGLVFDEIIDLLDSHQFVCYELGSLDCLSKYIEVPRWLIGLDSQKTYYQANQRYMKKSYDLYEKKSEFSMNELEKETFLNPSIRFYRIFSYIKKHKNRYHFCFYLKCKSLFSLDSSQINLFLDNQQLDIQCTKKLFFYKITFQLDENELTQLTSQNKFFISYLNCDGIGFRKDIEYTTISSLKGEYLKSKIFNIDGKTSFYLRQSLNNRLYLTVRAHNRTDSWFENLKINIAYYLSLFNHKDVIILYEKDSSRYEESASVVYENLIDRGYDNVYFILDKNYPDIVKIDHKYLDHIIFKYTFKHYLYFFMAQTFLGSELMIHAMELRNMNKHVLKKVNSTDTNNVFLQHGVMYMVSLDSESRKYFRPRKDGKGKFRVVTSSHEEANHFIQLGGYQPQQILISGLPKYDRNVLYDKADKIVIMLTWRVWEYNQAASDFQSTPYYKMLKRIVAGIDQTYRNRLIILPHPLFYKAAQDNEFELKQYMKFNVKYDEILRDTAVLITDYSSIAYDAFYRGSRVIFYWEELEECLEKYGQNTKLMLNNQNVFGDVCYNNGDLEKVLKKNYELAQQDTYIERYKKLVEFHDGKNTERLIDQLQNEHIL